MVKASKRMTKAVEKIEKGKIYTLKEGVEFLLDAPRVKFDETVELHIRLNIDPKSSEQIVRGTAVLPHGTGKKVRIAVFCKGDQALKAKELGVDYVGAEDLIDNVLKGLLDFDCVIATPDIMRDLSKLGKVLGPRGLMPSPKSGTVTIDIEKAVNEVRAGKVEFKSDKQAGVHVGVGKCSFSADKILENVKYLLDAINHAKPQTVKVDLIKSVALSTTMGPGVRVSL
ncbi:MAG: 50S ribosomal protein L1 [Candidatus Omnitrophica bacterium]|nr:50S ribosomal protein L1 [Candidatus Omnitrophota bacterium]